MDARVIGDAVLRTARPAHDTVCLAGGNDSQATTFFSQRSAVPGLCFSDARRARFPVFLPLPKERNGAPGGAQGALRSAPLRPALRSAGLHAELPGPKCLRAVGVPWR